MERLTIKSNKDFHLIKGFEDKTMELKAEQNVLDAIDAVIEKLAAYEDSSLTPERAIELGAADKNGRLVLLPCPPKSEVWVIWCNEVNRDYFTGIINSNDKGWRIWLRDIGAEFTLDMIDKRVFLTREAAEIALKESEING